MRDAVAPAGVESEPVVNRTRSIVEPDERFEIQLSHICNNRCVFCVSGQMTELRMAKPTPLGELVEQLEWAAARGISKVTILGGEPTIHRTFMDVMRRAIALDFADIFIFTNGARLADERFIDRVVALGGNITWRISIQGGDEATHDATTKKRGAFAKIRAGLQHLTDRSQAITLNMCVVEQNYRSLVGLADIVARWPVRQLHLDMVRPRDAGQRSLEYLDALMPDYLDLARSLDEALTAIESRRTDLDVNVGNLPPCLLPRWAHRIHHGGNETWTVAAEGDGQLSDAWNKFETKQAHKRKLPGCAECAFDHRCDGFGALYAERRSLDVFQPVNLQQLRQLDPRQRVLETHLRPGLQALAASPIVGGWSLASVDDDDHRGEVSLRLSNAEGATVDLVLLPAGVLGGGDGEHTSFALRLVAATCDAPTAGAVTAAVFERMAQALEGAVTAPPSRARIDGRRALWGPSSLVPQRIQPKLRRLLAGQPFDGWRIAHARPLLAQRGATVSLAAPSGEELDLDLVIGDDDRVQVRWHLDATSARGLSLAGEVDAAARQRMGRAVAAALRGRSGNPREHIERA